MDKLKKVDRLLEVFRSRHIHYDGKMKRARSSDSWEHHRSRRNVNYDLSARCHRLKEMIRKNEIPQVYDWSFSAKYDYHLRQARKEKGAFDFRTKCKYSRWFMSESLHADYGSYNCEKCGCRFYHSPSTITQGTKEIYHCVCGWCTNQFIKKDWGVTPFN